MTISQEAGEATYVAVINNPTTVSAKGSTYQFGNNSEILIKKYIGDVFQEDINPFESQLLVSATFSDDWCRFTGYNRYKVNYYVDSRGTTTGAARTSTVTFTFYNPDDHTKVITLDYPITQEANTIEKDIFVGLEFLPIDLALASINSSEYINPYSQAMDIFTRVNYTYSSGESAETLLEGEDSEYYIVTSGISLKTSTDTQVGSVSRLDEGGIRLFTNSETQPQTSGITAISIPGYEGT